MPEKWCAVIKAGIDLGTHTGRLIIAEVANGKISRVLYKHARIVALGEGTALTGKISEVALARAINLLQEYQVIIKKYQAETLRAVTTNAVRIAANKEEVLGCIRQTTGIDFEIISGETEACLGYTGIKSAFGGFDFLSFDIGGGSTEFALNINDNLAACFSLKIGSVSLTERFCQTDPINASEFNDLTAAVVEIIQPALLKLPLAASGLLIGVAGTVTNLAAIKQRMVNYDPAKIHKSRLSQMDIDDMIKNFRYRTIAERKQIIGLEPARAKVILAGAALIKCILQTTKYQEITVSESDLLEGLVLTEP